MTPSECLGRLPRDPGCAVLGDSFHPPVRPGQQRRGKTSGSSLKCSIFSKEEISQKITFNFITYLLPSFLSFFKKIVIKRI